MAREKVTITLDRERAEEARELVGASSTSEAIDQALRRMIKQERTRRDVAAYIRMPLTEEEVAMGDAPGDDWADLEDETDWESLYSDVLD
jgi:hypothetical protein